MLQKDGFFRKREEKREDSLFRPSQAVTAAPVVAANTDTDATMPPVEVTNERKEAKLVVGPDIKLKGVEISDCDTLIVEGRVEATLDSRVLEITPSSESALQRLSVIYTVGERWSDLLGLYDRALEATKDKARRIRLLRDFAA